MHPGCVPEALVARSTDSTGGDGQGKGVKVKGDDRVEWFDQVMYATGRKPNIQGLGLDNAGIALSSKGSIVVDEGQRTNVPNIYAVGDVTDRINLTPVALMEGKVAPTQERPMFNWSFDLSTDSLLLRVQTGMAVANTLFNSKPTKPDHEFVASAVFSQPPVASVGYTEEQVGVLPLFWREVLLLFSWLLYRQGGVLAWTDQSLLLSSFVSVSLRPWTNTAGFKYSSRSSAR